MGNDCHITFAIFHYAQRKHQLFHILFYVRAFSCRPSGKSKTAFNTMPFRGLREVLHNPYFVLYIYREISNWENMYKWLI